MSPRNHVRSAESAACTVHTRDCLIVGFGLLLHPCPHEKNADSAGASSRLDQLASLLGTLDEVRYLHGCAGVCVFYSLEQNARPQCSNGVRQFGCLHVKIFEVVSSTSALSEAIRYLGVTQGHLRSAVHIPCECLENHEVAQFCTKRSLPLFEKHANIQLKG